MWRPDFEPGGLVAVKALHRGAGDAVALAEVFAQRTCEVMPTITIVPTSRDTTTARQRLDAGRPGRGAGAGGGGGDRARPSRQAGGAVAGAGGGRERPLPGAGSALFGHVQLLHGAPQGALQGGPLSGASRAGPRVRACLCIAGP